MTVYEIAQVDDRIFDACAVVATGMDGKKRMVSRYLPRDQAEKMIERLQAMMSAEKVDV